jgi:FkbM family methyltransferase
MGPGLDESPPRPDPAHLRLRRCRHGLMLYSVSDIYLGTMLELYGEFSEAENDLFRQILRPGMTAVEIGANIGAHSLSIASMIGPKGRLLAFEPQRAVFQILCANLALNGVLQVEAHWAAIGNRDGDIRVPLLDPARRGNFGGVSLVQTMAGEAVRLVTLDSFALPQCHFLKIDCEGMEFEAIDGARATLARHAPIVYAENDRAGKAAVLIRTMFDLGYRCYWHRPAYVRIPNFRGNAENRFPGLRSTNMLCVPRSRGIMVTDLQEIVLPDQKPSAPGA